MLKITADEVVAMRRRYEAAKAETEAAEKAFGWAVEKFYAANPTYVFSATSRSACCEAPLAYRETGNYDDPNWRCWNVLRGASKADEPNHRGVMHDELPFSMYEIKSEHQPSANGATTRPPGAGPRFDAPWHYAQFKKVG